MKNNIELNNWIEDFASENNKNIGFCEYYILVEESFFHQNNREFFNDNFVCYDDFCYHPVHSIQNMEDLVFYQTT